MSISYNNMTKILSMMGYNVDMQVFMKHADAILLDVVLPFKKYKGQKVSEVAKTDKGLKYLKWLQSWIESLDGDDNFTEIAAVLEDYFGPVKELQKDDSNQPRDTKMRKLI